MKVVIDDEFVVIPLAGTRHLRRLRDSWRLRAAPVATQSALELS